MNSFETYCLYHAINLHFTSDKYDFFKYGGKTKVTIDSFEKRHDRYFFKKLNKKITDENDLIIFFVANILENDKNWIGNLLAEESFECYFKHKSVMESLKYRFEQDCNILFQEIENPMSIFKVSNEYPPILKKLFRKEINIETVCIIQKHLNFISYFDKYMSNDIRWPNIKKKIMKYTPFLIFDSNVYKNILKSHVNILTN